jgi:hypothetical protein
MNAWLLGAGILLGWSLVLAGFAYGSYRLQRARIAKIRRTLDKDGRRGRPEELAVVAELCEGSGDVFVGVLATYAYPTSEPPEAA